MSERGASGGVDGLSRVGDTGPMASAPGDPENHRGPLPWQRRWQR